MCGIAGIINFNNKPVQEYEIRLMMKKIKHRGPDDEGIFIDNNIGFGFVRLSIIDLSQAGHQPMFSADGRYMIIYNGEVYNYLELKSELSSKYNFITKTDTEVVLIAFQEWGVKCLNKFNGMFAFVIYDRKTYQIIVVRDRYGIKPFYYYYDNKTFIFASEIRSILPFLKERKPNNRIIYDYLLYNRTDHSEETFFKDVYKLQHGHYISIIKNKLSFNQWYNLKYNIGCNNVSSQQYRELFRDSLRLRLRSDVPVGVCLSGGLDSSAITASLIKDFNLWELNTFSTIYGVEEPSDESKFINEFKSLIKNMYFIYPSSESLYDDYENFIDAHNEPVPDIGPYVQFKVMQLAKDHVKVTLDGQGADEQLAGYHYFFGNYYIDLINKMKFIKLLSESCNYLINHRSIDAFKYLIYYLIGERGQRSISSKLFPSINKIFLNSSDSYYSINKLLYKPISLRKSLIQHIEYKLEHLLRWEDLNSMHFSIESRVPFLDYRLVEGTISLPLDKFIKNGVNKYILRESMKDILPKKIYLRKDKKGFSSPRDKWFRTDKLKTLIISIINSQKFSERGYFDSRIANKRYKMHLDNKIDISKEIWKWINLEIWFNRFIDEN